jgi:hypothetical protein
MRNRSGAIAITQNAKKRLSEEIALTQDMTEEHKKEKITSYLEEKLKGESNQIKLNNNKDDYIITELPPAYLDIRKEFHTKNEKVFAY